MKLVLFLVSVAFAQGQKPLTRDKSEAGKDIAYGRVIIILWMG